ncbi:MAG: beta-lactamase family protein [Bacteroidota bacterium]|nr:beta-lactamase family protein [Bacteroidota bacterium]
MKRILIAATALCIVHVTLAQEAGIKIDTLINAYAKLYRFNGSALVAKNGAILLNKGYGYRNASEKVWNNEQTIFQLGSITKQFTSAVILKLQEEKKLAVSDKLTKYFPNYPKGDSITVQQLLTHTSGIYNYTNDPNFMANEITKAATRKKMMALFQDKPLDFSPGISWNYSNSGYSLLGYIIEEVTKNSYEQAVRRYIFTPLHMTHSGFDFTHLKTGNKAIGYFKLNDKESIPAPIVDSTVSFSAGAMYATTGDLYLWSKGLENNKVLSKMQQEAAYTPVKNNYGYGWGIDSIDGKRRVGHGGGIPGFSTNISRVPEDDVCIILLSNASNESLNDITKSIYAILYNKEYELPKERKVTMLPEETLKQYEGEYEIRPGLTVVMNAKDGELLATPTGQSPKILHAEKEDSFFEKEEDVRVEFTRNDNKEVDGLVLYQGGGKMQCRKIK